jgi:transcriptional regulator with XRE-family HTH domain
MTYTTEDIARTLKGARETMGLSQRALSAKSGLTQTHISRIENAAVDIQLSNLLELARALDLEVMLVPRKAITAAQGLVRTIEAATRGPVDAGKAVRRLQHAVQKLTALYPEAKELGRLHELAAVFQNFQLNAERVHKIQDATRELQRVSQRIQKAKPSNIPVSGTEIQRVGQITRQLQDMRNAIVHAAPTTNLNRVLPAYRLDEGDSDG